MSDSLWPHSLPGFSVHGICQTRILEWVALPSVRGSSWPRDRIHIFCVGRQILYHWATREAWSGITSLIYTLPFFIPLLPGFQMSYLYDRNHAQESGYTQNHSLTLPQCQTSSLSTGKLGCFATVTRSFHIPPEHSPTALLTTLRGVHLEIKMWPLLTISPQTYGKSREYKSWVSHFVPAPRAQQAVELTLDFQDELTEWWWRDGLTFLIFH